MVIITTENETGREEEWGENIRNWKRSVWAVC